MAAAVPLIAVAASAAITGVQLHNADVQRENAEIDARELKRRQQQEADELAKSQKEYDSKLAIEQKRQTLLTDEQNKKDSERDRQLAEQRKRKGISGRQSTILTGPMGLSFEDTVTPEQKTLIGG